jgi:NTP pyrophosphatase (non-canonical NTP hydrolase)
MAKRKLPSAIGLRDDLAWFAALMEQTLRDNDHKGGWYGCSIAYLRRRLAQEMKELREALDSGHAERVVEEAADVANFAMMLACHARVDMLPIESTRKARVKR